MIRSFALALVALITLAAPAHAAPVGALIGLLSGAAGFTGAVSVLGLATSSLAFRLLATVALSSLSRALAPRPKSAGIKTSTTTGGDVPPATFILGRYATAGHAVCPAMSHGRAGRVPNAYLTYVIEVGDIAGQTLERLIVDGEYAEIGTVADPDYGFPLLGRFTLANGTHFAWVKYHDGSQTVADPMLLAKYGDYPERPWTADMIGTGLCYAIVTFRYARKIFTNFPAVKFEMNGIPLYDPRLDTSVGGSGAQRWADRATWAWSDNPAVQAYNILRGVTLPGLGVWGGEASAADLSLGNWFAAMNECDVSVLQGDGITNEPQYRTGFEVGVADEPAAVLEELLKGCSGALAEIGGTWKCRVGSVGLPVWQFTDDDILITSEQAAEPFPGLDATWNAIHASYPEPEQMWAVKDAPPRYNAGWEATDGDRQLVADLSLSAVPYGDQVQRLMRAYIEEERRFARHTLTLPATAAVLEPLDAVAWSSERNGYIAKVFEVVEVVDDPATMLQAVTLRERDPADYDWVPGFTLPSSIASGVVNLPPAQVVPGWAVSGIALADATSAARRPALRLVWDGADADDQHGLEWEVRLTGGATNQRGSTAAVAVGEMVLADGILPATSYEARARFVVDRPTEWSAWLTATTPDTRLGVADLDDPVRAALDEAMAVRAAAEAGAAAVLATAQDEIDALTGQVIAAFGPLATTPPLASQITDNFAAAEAGAAAVRAEAQGWVDALTGQVITAFGPLATTPPLASQITDNLALSMPREVHVADALDRVDEQLLWLATRLSATQSGVADAGIYTDPATGVVRIEAVNRLDGALGEVSLTLDAALGEIALRATVAYVDETVSAAILDPTQIPIIADLELRINDVELGLSAAEASIVAKADTVVVDGLDVSLTQAELDIDGLEAAVALKVNTTAFTPLETRVTDAEIALDAIDGAALSINLQDSRATAEAVDDAQIINLGQLLDSYEDRTMAQADIAYVRDDFRALVDEDRNALASQKLELGVAIDSAVALVVSETSARAAADLAETAARLEMQVALDGTAAALISEQGARVDGDSAQASRSDALEVRLDGTDGDVAAGATAINGLDVRVTSAEGAISAQSSSLTALSSTVNDPVTGLPATYAGLTSLSVTSADADSALSIRTDALEATTGDLSATVDVQAAALATLEGNASATYTIRLAAGGAAAGFEIVAADDPINGPQSTILFHADNIISDGTISGNQLVASNVITNSAQIANAVITNAHIAGAVQSNDFVDDVVGWQINKNGTAQFNNLIVRGSLQVGAVSDTYEVIAPGPFTATGTVATLTLGGIVQPGRIFKRGLVVELYGRVPPAFPVTLEARNQTFGGAWGAWYVVSTIEKDSDAVWDAFGRTSNLNGHYDNFQYRVQFIGGVGRSIRNIQLTLIEVVR